MKVNQQTTLILSKRSTLSNCKNVNCSMTKDLSQLVNIICVLRCMCLHTDVKYIGFILDHEEKELLENHLNQKMEPQHPEDKVMMVD